MSLLKQNQKKGRRFYERRTSFILGDAALLAFSACWSLRLWRAAGGVTATMLLPELNHEHPYQYQYAVNGVGVGCWSALVSLAYGRKSPPPRPTTPRPDPQIIIPHTHTHPIINTRTHTYRAAQIAPERPFKHKIDTSFPPPAPRGHALLPFPSRCFPCIPRASKTAATFHVVLPSSRCTTCKAS